MPHGVAFDVRLPIMRSAACALVLLSLAAAPIARTQTANGARSADLTGSVSGHVVLGDTGQPARFARVSLQPVTAAVKPAPSTPPPAKPETPPSTTVETSLDGSFTLADVKPGPYYVEVEKEGYINPRAMFSAKEMNEPTPELRAMIDAALPRVRSRRATPKARTFASSAAVRSVEPSSSTTAPPRASWPSSSSTRTKPESGFRSPATPASTVRASTPTTSATFAWRRCCPTPTSFGPT